MLEPQLKDLFDRHDPATEPPLSPDFLESSLAIARRRASRRNSLRAATSAASVAVAVVALTFVGGMVNNGNGPDPSKQQTATPEPTAAQILENAALDAEQEAFVIPRNDQFVYVESVNNDVARGVTVLYRAWFSVDGTHDGLVKSQQMSGKPMGEAYTFSVPLPGCHDGWMETYKGPRQMGKVACSPRPAYLPDLPTDPDAMYEYLYAEAGKPPRSSGGEIILGVPQQVPDEELAFRLAHELLTGSKWVSPKARAALFKAMAKIPGITVQHDATDGAGRAGIALSYTGFDRETIIFDRETFKVLGRYGSNPQGGQEFSSVLMKHAIVDKVGQIP